MKKILVIDDEASMREMLGIMLRKEGYAVEIAANRSTAAAVLDRGPVNMVITDVKLPDGDGIEILRHLRAASPDTVVVVMTAYGSTETAVAALSEADRRVKTGADARAALVAAVVEATGKGAGASGTRSGR